MFETTRDHAYRAFRILQFTFIVAPLLAGADKFFYFLTNWSQYISPFALKMIDYQDRSFMIVVGIIEITAGIGVLFKPKVFAYIVSAWLFAIICNLLMTGHYFDIALRDLGLCLAALSLGHLSQKYAN